MRPNWFVGLPVDGADWLAPLLDGAPPDLRCVHPEDLHLTVAFFGGVDEIHAMRGWSIAERLRHGPISVRLSGLVPMGNPRRPTALSVTLDEGRDATIALIAAIKADMLEAAGTPADRRPIKPHITVARPPRKAASADRRRAVAWAKALAPIGARVTLDRIALYTWSEERRDRKFRVVANQVLEGES